MDLELKPDQDEDLISKKNEEHCRFSKDCPNGKTVAESIPDTEGALNSDGESNSNKEMHKSLQDNPNERTVTDSSSSAESASITEEELHKSFLDDLSLKIVLECQILEWTAKINSAQKEVEEQRRNIQRVENYILELEADSQILELEVDSPQKENYVGSCAIFDSLEKLRRNIQGAKKYVHSRILELEADAQMLELEADAQILELEIDSPQKENYVGSCAICDSLEKLRRNIQSVKEYEIALNGQILEFAAKVDSAQKEEYTTLPIERDNNKEKEIKSSQEQLQTCCQVSDSNRAASDSAEEKTAMENSPTPESVINSDGTSSSRQP